MDRRAFCATAAAVVAAIYFHKLLVSMKLEFKGVFPAPPTPTTEDGRVNEKALRALLDDNIEYGCGGFWMTRDSSRRVRRRARRS